MVSPLYARGKKAWGICRVCGLRDLLDNLTIDEYYPGLRVHQECFNSKHPQERIYPLSDPVALWRPSPEDYNVVSPELSAELIEGEELSIDLSWTAATTLGPRYEAYKLYRAERGGDGQWGEYAEIFEGEIEYDDFMAIVSQELGYEDSDVEEGILYRYKVVALDVYEHGAQSNVVEIGDEVIAPSAPVLSGENLTVSIDLAWTASVQGSAPIEFYRLFRSVDSGNYSLLYEGADLLYQDNDVDFSLHGSYDYYVTAHAEDDGFSENSNVFEGKVDPSPWLLMHYDGVDEQPNTIDSGANNFAVQRGGAARLSTEQMKFGTASYEGSPNDYFFIDDIGLVLSDQDFTVEAWVYVSATNTREMAFVHALASWYFGIFANNRFIFYWDEPGGTPHFDFVNHVVQLNAWHHYAAARQGNSIRMFVDGVQVGTINIGANSIRANTQVNFGNQPDAIGSAFPQHLRGYMDEVRMVVGQAMYTANFTPLDRPFV